MCVLLWTLLSINQPQSSGLCTATTLISTYEYMHAWLVVIVVFARGGGGGRGVCTKQQRKKWNAHLVHTHVKQADVCSNGAKQARQAQCLRIQIRAPHCWRRHVVEANVLVQRCATSVARGD
jgi:hypothetical protein